MSLKDLSKTSMNKSKRIFSGVQPSGDLHIGNYLGAIKNFVSLQKEYECFFCVVDLHAITVWQDPQQLAHKTREVTAAFIASGIDSDKNVLFSQSQVPQHAQLAWIFSCVARMGWLNRMTQFKDKAGKDKENVSVGLFSYPTLMAADILVYLATHVPVGEDQKQHLELCRDIAQKFNNDFNSPNFLKVPEPLIQKDFARIMSLKDGLKKMSKSDPSDFSRINLTDEKDLIINKIKKAKTDALPMPSKKNNLEKRPEVLNLLGIYSSLSNQNLDKVKSKFEGKNFSLFKDNLSELLIEKIEPIGKKIKDLLKDEKYLDKILNKGAEKADSLALKKITKMKTLVGF